MCEAHLPHPAPIATAGTYLRLRRKFAGLSIDQVAERLAALPWAIIKPSPEAVRLLAERVMQAEAPIANKGAPFTAPQAALLRNIFRFDVEIYLQLVDVEAAGEGCGLPVPQICTGCGCTWHDACMTATGPCAWSDADATRCTGCPPIAADRAAAEPELVS